MGFDGWRYVVVLARVVQKGADGVIVKKLVRSWLGKAPGSTVVIDDDRHEELLLASVVEPTAEVKQLIREWEGPEGVIYPADTRVELDAATARELKDIGAIRPTGV
jgi:hypothetical protein